MCLCFTAHLHLQTTVWVAIRVNKVLKGRIWPLESGACLHADTPRPRMRWAFLAFLSTLWPGATKPLCTNKQINFRIPEVEHEKTLPLSDVVLSRETLLLSLSVWVWGYCSCFVTFSRLFIVHDVFFFVSANTSSAYYDNVVLAKIWLHQKWDNPALSSKRMSQSETVWGCSLLFALSKFDWVEAVSNFLEKTWESLTVLVSPAAATHGT